jgi:hypothetical protein
MAAKRSYSPCSKCGSDDVGTHYHAQGCSDPDCGDWCNKCSWGSHNKQHAEHLHRYCRMCHYDWIEPVLVAA